MYLAPQLLEAEVFAVALIDPSSSFFAHVQGPCALLLDLLIPFQAVASASVLVLTQALASFT